MNMGEMHLTGNIRAKRQEFNPAGTDGRGSHQFPGGQTTRFGV
jgi:hypothetical protein